MLSRFLRWWGRQLLESIPQPLRRPPEQRFAHLEIELGEDRIIISRLTGTRRSELATFSRDDSPSLHAGSAPRARLIALLERRLAPEKTQITISLPGHRALTRVVELPTAAEENLHEVLGYELHRLTPFRREDVYFDGRKIERIAGTRGMRVALDVVPKGAVDEGLDILSDWDEQRGERDVRVARDGERIRVVLVPRSLPTRAPTRINAVLAAVNLSLLAVVIAIPLLGQESTLDALRSELAGVEHAANRAGEMQERLARIQSELDFLTSAKTASPPFVEILEEVSRFLPDDTWLERLEVAGHQIRLAGYSAAASALIEQLDDSALLADVSFISPVTRDQRTGSERFNLSAQLVTEAPEP